LAKIASAHVDFVISGANVSQRWCLGSISIGRRCKVTGGGDNMREVVVEDRTWSAEDDNAERGSAERLRSDDPVEAAGVNYGYARI
jgi:hypothetical protein